MRALRGILATIGVLLFLGAVASAVLTSWGASSSPPPSGGTIGSAAAYDDPDDGGGEGSLPPCAWAITDATVGEVPEKLPGADTNNIVMSENEDLALYVVAAPFEGDEECEGNLTAHGPNFRISPEDISSFASSQEPAPYVIILAPQKPGKHMFSLSSDVPGFFQARHVEVRNWMGLSPFWAQTLTAAGGVFGPMLTIPWWLERRKEREGEEGEGARTQTAPSGPPES
jgi:hypothetical protein